MNCQHLAPGGYFLENDRLTSLRDPPVASAGEGECANLKQYAGHYQLADSNTCVISLKNDTLFIMKKTGGPVALFAETENIFFRRADTRGRKIFVKNEKGDMLMLERRNGNDLSWKRIK